jgi:GT2 family glycosyltransferase
VAALIACNNRKSATLSCLRSLMRQAECDGHRVSAFVVDDGSSDGTSEAIAEGFPSAKLIQGSGDLYWAGGMRLAFAHAQRSEFDYFLLLNDDSNLRENSIEVLLLCARELRARTSRPGIVVGTMMDVETGKTSYGGWRAGSIINRLKCQRVEPTDSPVACDTFNGNCVLIPKEILQSIGGLDEAFTHSMADMDYGFRASRAGWPIWVAPGVVGSCSKNLGGGLWVDYSLPTMERWRRLLGPKGLPPGEWLRFTFRHAGPLWPLIWAKPYLMFWVRAAMFSLGVRH